MRNRFSYFQKSTAQENGHWWYKPATVKVDFIKVAVLHRFYLSILHLTKVFFFHMQNLPSRFYFWSAGQVMEGSSGSEEDDEEEKEEKEKATNEGAKNEENNNKWVKMWRELLKRIAEPSAMHSIKCGLEVGFAIIC